MAALSIAPEGLASDSRLGFGERNDLHSELRYEQIQIPYTFVAVARENSYETLQLT